MCRWALVSESNIFASPNTQRRTVYVGEELEHDGLQLRVRPYPLRKRRAEVLPAAGAASGNRPEHADDAVPAEGCKAANRHVRVPEEALALRAGEELIQPLRQQHAAAAARAWAGVGCGSLFLLLRRGRRGRRLHHPPIDLAAVKMVSVDRVKLYSVQSACRVAAAGMHVIDGIADFDTKYSVADEEAWAINKVLKLNSHLSLLSLSFFLLRLLIHLPLFALDR